MPQCPSCHETLNQDFGMVTCSNCQAVLMVDINGHVQVGREIVGDDLSEDEASALDQFSAIENTPLETQWEESPVFDPPELEAPFADQEVTQESEPTELDDENSLEENSLIDEGEQEDSYDLSADLPDHESESFAEVTSSEIKSEEHLFEDHQDDEEDPLLSPAVVTVPDEKPVDITSFANSEESSLEGGELLYDIYIGRLDSKDLREELKYILLDEKLKLNHHEFLRSIKDGQLVIPNLNPIKAKRIAEQLQFLEVSLRWAQKRVVMEPEASSSSENEDDTLGSQADV